MSDLIERQPILDEIRSSIAHFEEMYTSDELRMLNQFEQYISILPSASKWNPFLLREITEEEKLLHPKTTYMMDEPRPKAGQDIIVTDGERIWTDVFCVVFGDAFLLNAGTEFWKYRWIPIPSLLEADDGTV